MDPSPRDHPCYPEARRHARELRGFHSHALACVRECLERAGSR